MNTLYFGDNLNILRTYVEDASVDLVYLDPPFNSKAQYNVLFEGPSAANAEAQAGAFVDSWEWGEESAACMRDVARHGGAVAKLLNALHSALGQSDLMAYLAMMAPRLIELRRVLKDTGSLYLHCDPTASHYLKIILDSLFGAENFRNEIAWKRTGAHGSAKRWGPIHDVLLFYTASRSYVWNRVTQEYEPDYLRKHYSAEDQHGRFQPVSLTGPGTRKGSSGRPWRDIDPSQAKRHWATPQENALPQWFEKPKDWSIMSCQERLDRLDQVGLIHWPEKGRVPRFKRYLEVAKGNPIQDMILDIGPLSAMSAERIGYPTQKPVALLKRIILASSNPGDVILDPFCGCGTTIEAAETLDRRWIGADVAIHAIKVIQARLNDNFESARYSVHGIPEDFASAELLAERNKYQFQWWANYLFDPHALREHRQKKGADRGVDGELFFPNGPQRPLGRIIISVKGGRSVGPAMVRELGGTLKAEGAEMGLFVCLRRPTTAMRQAAYAEGIADTVHGDLPRLQIVSIEEWFDGKTPALPPLYSLPSAAFSKTKRRAAVRSKKGKAPDPRAPEFIFEFPSVPEPEAGVVRHLNLARVKEGKAATG